MEVKEKMLSKQQIALIRYLLGVEADTPKNIKAEVQRAETGEVYKCAIYNTPYGSFIVLTENTPEKFAYNSHVYKAIYISCINRINYNVYIVSYTAKTGL